MKLVLDTNVVVSAFINPQGNPSKIIELVLKHRADFCYNSAILSEYDSVMLHPKFSDKINSNNIHRLINLLRSIGTPFNPLTGKIKLSDESDRIFYDTAKQSGSILISGNLKHFPKEPFIMSPSDLLNIIKP